MLNYTIIIYEIISLIILKYIDPYKYLNFVNV